MFLKIQVATILIPRNAFEVFYVPSSLIWPMLIPAFFTRAIFPTETIFCHCSFTWGIFNNPLKLIKRDHLFLLCPELWQNNSPSDLVTAVKLGASCWQAWYFSYFLVAETQDVISIWWYVWCLIFMVDETQERLSICGPLNLSLLMKILFLSVSSNIFHNLLQSYL